MLELIAGLAVAFAAVALVLQPLLAGTAAEESATATEVEFEELEESASPKIQALLALKEIEFDHATGKLSNEDYAALKNKYSAAALAAIKSEEEGADAAEELVRRVAEGKQAVCPNCGPRPEVDAVFCSKCGRPLAKTAGVGAQ